MIDLREWSAQGQPETVFELFMEIRGGNPHADYDVILLLVARQFSMSMIEADLQVLSGLYDNGNRDLVLRDAGKRRKPQ